MSPPRIDRLCWRRDVPLREKTLWRMLHESASRASAVLALNVEDLGLPNKQAKIVAKGGTTMWITWGTDTAHLLPRLIASRTSGPLFLSEYRPGPHRRATTDPKDACPETGGHGWATTAPVPCWLITATDSDSINSGTARPHTWARPEENSSVPLGIRGAPLRRKRSASRS